MVPRPCIVPTTAAGSTELEEVLAVVGIATEQ